MYRHILIPTDGSRLAMKGAKAGIGLARALGARVTAVCVRAPYVAPIYSEAMVYSSGGVSARDYEKSANAFAARALGAVARAARAARVSCARHTITDPQPWSGILRAARSRRCDAIVMASHGRGGLGGLLLGSETTRVLAHSKLPVLVIR